MGDTNLRSDVEGSSPSQPPPAAATPPARSRTAAGATRRDASRGRRCLARRAAAQIQVSSAANRGQHAQSDGILAVTFLGVGAASRRSLLAAARVREGAERSPAALGFGQPPESPQRERRGGRGG